MPQRDTTGIGERVPRELIEADFAVAFGLVEMAEKERGKDDGQLAAQLLARAGRMLEDIKSRLRRLTASQKEPFDLRCAELAAAIESAGPQSGADTAA